MNQIKILIKRQLYKPYLHIAEHLYHQAKQKYRGGPYVGEESKKFLIGAVMFLYFTLESFLNEFGYYTMDEDYEEIERLSVKQKLVLLPRIAGKSLFRKQTRTYKIVKKLQKYRNLFVHQKPKYIKLDDKNEVLYQDLNFDKVETFYKTVLNIIKKIQSEFKIYSPDDEDWITIYKPKLGKAQ